MPQDTGKAMQTSTPGKFTDLKVVVGGVGLAWLGWLPCQWSSCSRFWLAFCSAHPANSITAQ